MEQLPKYVELALELVESGRILRRMIKKAFIYINRFLVEIQEVQEVLVKSQEEMSNMYWKLEKR